MLDAAELADVAEAFGVAEDQVRRDHLISHILLAIGATNTSVTFFGGTALSRTHLGDPTRGARLSEDVDLYSAQRRSVASALDGRLPHLLRREFPGSRWDPSLADVRGAVPGELVTREVLRVRIQLLDSRGEHHDLAAWPTEMRSVDLRYHDTPAAVMLRVPTLDAFAAMKTIAWLDRRAPRDLYDLAGLARRGALTAEAARLVRRVVGWPPSPPLFASCPPLNWDDALAHQTRDPGSPDRCLADVRRAWTEVLERE